MTPLKLISLLIVFILSSSVLAQDNTPDPTLFEITRAVQAVTNANLRAQPSANSLVVGTLARNQQIIIVGEVPEGQSVSGNSLWYQVQFEDDAEAYVWAGAVSEPIIVETRCLRIFESDVNSDGRLWVLRRTGSRLLTYNEQADGLRMASEYAAGDNFDWSYPLTLAELQAHLSSSSVPVEQYVDQQTCVGNDLGVAIWGNRPYFAVRQESASETIRFLPTSSVTEVLVILPDEFDVLVNAAADEAYQRAIERLEILSIEEIDGVTVGYTRYDAPGMPHWRLDGDRWVDQHLGRRQYEAHLPRGFFNEYGERVTWDNAVTAYRRDDGYIFRPYLGIVPEETVVRTRPRWGGIETFQAITNQDEIDAGHLEHGWVLETSRFVGEEITLVYESNDFLGYDVRFNPYLLENPLAMQRIERMLLERFPALHGGVFYFQNPANAVSSGTSGTSSVLGGAKAIIEVTTNVYLIRLPTFRGPSGPPYVWGTDVEMLARFYEIQMGGTPWSIEEWRQLYDSLGEFALDLGRQHSLFRIEPRE